MHAQEYLVVSWLQALLFVTGTKQRRNILNQHWKVELRQTTVSLLPPLCLRESLNI